jgi:hypothetical protein
MASACKLGFGTENATEALFLSVFAELAFFKFSDLCQYLLLLYGFPGHTETEIVGRFAVSLLFAALVWVAASALCPT